MTRELGYVVAVGNAFDGMSLFGPFDSTDDASDWAGTNLRNEEWLVVSILEAENRETEVSDEPPPENGDLSTD